MEIRLFFLLLLLLLNFGIVFNFVSLSNVMSCFT